MKEIFTHDDTVKALQSWIDLGEQSFGKAHQGYFSGNGWAARVLRSHVEALLSPKKSEPPSASVPEAATPANADPFVKLLERANAMAPGYQTMGFDASEQHHLRMALHAALAWIRHDAERRSK